MELFAFTGLVWAYRVQRQPGCDPGAKILTVEAMLTYSLDTNSAPHPRFDNAVGFDRGVAFVPQTALRSRDRYSRSGEDGEQSRHFRPGPLADLRTGEVIDQ